MTTNNDESHIAPVAHSKWRRRLEEVKRIQPLQGTRRLAKFVFGQYVKPMNFEQRLRAMGVKLGKNVQLQRFTVDERYARLLTIEDDASIGKGTTIYLSDGSINTVLDDPSPPPVKFGAVRICKGAVVTRNSIILSGVTIGEYAIVGAGSLVAKDVPPYAVVAGVPAKVLGSVKEMKEKTNHVAESEENDEQRFHIYMPNWRRRKRIGMTLEEQDLYYKENFPKLGV